MKKLWLLAVPVAMSLVLAGCDAQEKHKAFFERPKEPPKHYVKCNGKWVDSSTNPSCDDRLKTNPNDKTK